MMWPCFSGASRLIELPWPVVWDLVVLVLEKQTSPQVVHSTNSCVSPTEGQLLRGVENRATKGSL